MSQQPNMSVLPNPILSYQQSLNAIPEPSPIQIAQYISTTKAYAHMGLLCPGTMGIPPNGLGCRGRTQ